MSDEAKHARLGCSNPRWEPCPGSIREEAAYPDISSSAAMDGTGSHLLLELCLKSKVQAKQFDGQTIGVGDVDSPQKMGWYVEIDRIIRVQSCLDYIAGRAKGLHDNPLYTGCKIYTISENKIDPGKFYGRSDWWGTCDIFIYVVNKNTNKLMYIEACDYKDGRMYVSEVNNNQLKDYLLGMVLTLKDSGINVDDETLMNITIHQPKIKNKPRRTAPVRYSDLMAHGNQRSLAAIATDDPNAPLSAGKHCTFCNHKSNCIAKQNNRITKGDIMSDNIILKVETQLQTMSADDLAAILNLEKEFSDAITKVKIETMKRLKAGEPIPGYFIGEGPVKTAWNVEEDILLKKLASMKVPKDQRVKTTTLSPAQARKLACLSDKQLVNLESLIVTIAGKPALKKGEPKKRDAKELFQGANQSISEPQVNLDFM